MLKAMLISVIIVCVLIIFRRYIVKAEEYLRLKNLDILVIISGSVIIGTSLLSPTLHAEWWMYNDHEIMHFIGKQRALHASKFNLPLYLSDTEVGEFGKSLRFRPIFYSVRIMESFLWGNSALGWWALRMFFFIATFAILWYLVSRPLGIVSGAVFSLWVFSSRRYWTDIYDTISTQEIYCVIGVALYALGFYTAVKKVMKCRERPPLFSWIIMLIGGVLAIGSKENFVMMVVPAFILLAFLLWQKKADWLAWTTTILLALFSTLIIAAIAIAVSHTGHDYYCTKVSVETSTGIAINAIKQLISYEYNVGVIVVVLFFELIFGVFFRKALNEYLKLTAKFAVVLVLLGVLIVSQKVFYHGNWPVGTRYDFPGMLFENFYALSVAVYVIQNMKLLKMSINVPYTFVSICIGFMIYVCIQSGLPIHRGAKIAASCTRQFTMRITQITATAKGHPEMPILIESSTLADYETIGSLRRFLLAGGVTNKMYLRLHDQEGYYDKNNSLQIENYGRLVLMSKGNYSSNYDKSNFTPNYSIGGFEPLSNLPQNHITIYFYSKESLLGFYCLLVRKDRAAHRFSLGMSHDICRTHQVRLLS